MQAIIYEEFGGPEVLKLGQVEAPTPTAGNVLIDVAAASVNPFDWKLHRGYFASFFEFEFPVVAGLDVAGVVREVGTDVSDFAPGDRVFGWDMSTPVRHGAFAEQTVARASALAKLPDTLSFVQGAALPMIGLTASQALEGLREGDACLIQAGAGGVGSIAIQLAKRAGATVYTTASKRNLDYVRELGADVAIDYREQDFAKVIPTKLDRIVDSRGGETLARSYELLKPDGRMVSLVEPDKDGNMFGCRPDGEVLARLANLFAGATIRLPPIETRSLADAAQTLRDSEAGHIRGKLVLEIR